MGETQVSYIGHFALRAVIAVQRLPGWLCARCTPQITLMNTKSANP
jgi:hypothetical protein